MCSCNWAVSPVTDDVPNFLKQAVEYANHEFFQPSSCIHLCAPFKLRLNFNNVNHQLPHINTIKGTKLKHPPPQTYSFCLSAVAAIINTSTEAMIPTTMENLSKNCRTKGVLRNSPHSGRHVLVPFTPSSR